MTLFGVVAKIPKNQETHHETRIPERDVTYIVLSVYLLTLTSPIRHKMGHTQVNLSWYSWRHFELELDFAKYIQYGLCADYGSLLGPYTIYRVTSYLRLLALFILTCSPNMSFLARLVADNSRNLEKFELVTLSSQPPLRKKFCTGSEFLFYQRARFVLLSYINFRDINGFAN